MRVVLRPIPLANLYKKAANATDGRKKMLVGQIITTYYLHSHLGKYPQFAVLKTSRDRKKFPPTLGCTWQRRIETASGTLRTATATTDSKTCRPRVVFVFLLAYRMSSSAGGHAVGKSGVVKAASLAFLHAQWEVVALQMIDSIICSSSAWQHGEVGSRLRYPMEDLQREKKRCMGFSIRGKTRVR